MICDGTSYYYVYIENIAGRELISRAVSKEQAEQIKEAELAKWQQGDSWDIIISDKKLEEHQYWD